MLYKEHDVNRNEWSKVAEKIGFHTKRYTNVDMKNLMCITSGKELKS